MIAQKIILEACVDSVESATAAEAGGAHRLELCAALHLDGITPAASMIKSVQGAVRIPVKVMIRPRGGDFVYSAVDFAQMFEAIQMCKTLGVTEIVTGILESDDTLDIQRLRILAQAAHPMTMTIHKCIDHVPDISAAIADLRSLQGVTHILSSGQARTAWEGRKVLKEMLQTCGEDLTLIVAGQVTQENLGQLVGEIGAREYHGRKIVWKE